MLDKTLLARFGRDAEAVRVALAREFTAFEALPVELSGVWLEPRAPGKWSPAQTTEHVMKVNTGMSKTLYLLRRDAPLPEQTRTPGTLVEGRAQAPEFSRPEEGLSWAALEPTWLELKTRFLAEAEQAVGFQPNRFQPNRSQPDRSQIDSSRSDVAERTWFHPYFGDLDALGWVQAAAFHMAHHRKQLSVLKP